MALTLLLRCTDLERTRAFYTALPGFSLAPSTGDTLTVTGHGARIVFTAADLWHRAPTLTGTLYFTVPDIDAATRFFEAAFSAEVIYDSKTPADPPTEGPEAEKMLGVLAGTKVLAVRMLQLHHGPGVELFQVSVPKQRDPLRPMDYGFQHFAFYVNDLPAAVSQL